MHTIEFSRTRHHPYTTNPMVLREADLPPSVPLSRAVLGNLSSLAHISCAAAQTYEPAASASGSVALTRDYITRIHTINANTTANRARRAPGPWPGAATAHTEAAAPARKSAKRDALPQAAWCGRATCTASPALAASYSPMNFFSTLCVTFSVNSSRMMRPITHSVEPAVNTSPLPRVKLPIIAEPRVVSR